jgi:hypothetical protein
MAAVCHMWRYAFFSQRDASLASDYRVFLDQILHGVSTHPFTVNGGKR